MITEYLVSQPALKVGQITRSGEKTEAAQSAAESGFGRACIRSTAEGYVEHPSGTAGDFCGVPVFEHIMPDSSVTLDIAAEANFTMMRKGRINIYCEAAVVRGGPLFYRHANAGAAPEALGAFRGDDDGASGDVTELTDGFYIHSASTADDGGGFKAEVEFNLPV